MYQTHVAVYTYLFNAGHQQQHAVDADHLYSLRPYDVLGSVIPVVYLRLALRLGQSDQMTVDGWAWYSVIGRPVGAEERATDQVGSGEGSGRPGTVTFADGIQHGGPVTVGTWNEDLVQVGEHHQRRAAQTPVETVVERCQLTEVVDGRDQVLHGRPDVHRDGKGPRHDGDQPVLAVRVEERAGERACRVVVEDKVAGAEHAVHFHHLDQLLVVVVAVVERRHADGEVDAGRWRRGWSQHL